MMAYRVETFSQLHPRMTLAPLPTGSLGQCVLPECSEPGKTWYNETKEELEVGTTAPYKMSTNLLSVSSSEAGLRVHGPPAEGHRCSAHTFLDSRGWGWGKRQQI